MPRPLNYFCSARNVIIYSIASLYVRLTYQPLLDAYTNSTVQHCYSYCHVSITRIEWVTTFILVLAFLKPRKLSIWKTFSRGWGKTCTEAFGNKATHTHVSLSDWVLSVTMYPFLDPPITWPSYHVTPLPELNKRYRLPAPNYKHRLRSVAW